MYLWLTDAQSQQIARHAIAGAPEEVCGIMGGVGQRVQQITAIPNVAAQPQQHYEMDHQALVEALFALERAGQSLIGFYHSHPRGDPLPSSTDIAQAYYPDAAYVIVGLRHPEPRLAAWSIRYGQVDPVTLYIGDEPPPVDAEPGLSRAQVAAIVTSALLAFALLLMLSLSLLPPAPRIPPTP